MEGDGKRDGNQLEVQRGMLGMKCNDVQARECRFVQPRWVKAG